MWGYRLNIIINVIKPTYFSKEKFHFCLYMHVFVCVYISVYAEARA